MKSILTLFAASLVLYAFFHAPRYEQTFQGMIVKCLPIVLLQVLVARHGLSSNDSYGHRILAALIFSSFGDAFLDFPGYFIHGALSFMVAHFIYISAFGFDPLNLATGIKTFVILSLPSILLLESLTKLEGISSVVLPTYAIVLKVMVWRSLVKSSTSPLDKKDNTIDKDWAKLATGLGGIFFAISDTVLGFDKFYQPFPFAHTIVMATYYAAQLCLALSVFQKRPNTIYQPFPFAHKIVMATYYAAQLCLALSVFQKRPNTIKTN